MSGRHGSSLVLLISVCTIALMPRGEHAAEPWPPPAGMPAADPQKILDRIFGEETKEDEKALAQVEVSLQEERQLGETAVGDFLAGLRQRKIAVVSRGKDAEYLRDLVAVVRPMMAQANRYPTIRIYVAQSSECEARSFPGGTIVFFRGLLELAGSEAAVVGIAGHELSHLDRGHLLSRARRIKLAQQTLAGKNSGVSPEQFLDAGTRFTQIWTHPFRPEDEAVADSDGARWACRAGYDPREMAKLFLALGERQKNRQFPLPTFLQSHPDPQSRHQAIMKLYGEWQEAHPNEQLDVGRENLQRRIARSHQRFDK
jgi:predicted Zn-dependent protease